MKCWHVLGLNTRSVFFISFCSSVFPISFFISLTDEARVYTISQNSSVFQFCNGQQHGTRCCCNNYCHYFEKKKRRKPRTTWVKPWLQKRSQLGMYDTLLREFREEDIDEYQKFLRMRPETFNVILESQHHIPQARLCFPSTDKTTQFA